MKRRTLEIPRVCGRSIANGATNACLRRSVNRHMPSLSINRAGQQRNGVWHLPAALTINSITQYPVFRYVTDQYYIDTTEWAPFGYGETLPIAYSGDDPTVDYGGPLVGDIDNSVRFNDGKYYEASGNTFADITTEDFVIEAIVSLQLYPSANAYITFKITGSNGWLLYWSATTAQLRGALGDGTVSYPILATLADADLGKWAHFLLFFDRSGSASGYVNGVYNTATNISARSGSLASAVPFKLGRALDSAVAYITMWKGASWLDSHLQPTIAKERFAQVCGLYPQYFKGTAVPTTMTRDSAACVEKHSAAKKLFPVCDNWICMDEIVDKGGISNYGIHTPMAETNELVESCTLATAPWATNGSPTITENSSAIVDPCGNGKSCKIEGLGDSGVTDIYQNLATTTFANSAKLALGFWLYKIDSDVIAIENSQAAGNGKWTINLSGLPSGWNYIKRDSPYITVINEFTATGAGAAGVRFYKASGTDVDCYVYNVQLVENGHYQLFGEIPITVASAQTRAACSFYYKGDDGNLPGAKEGAVSFKMFLPDMTVYSAIPLLKITDGGAAADQILIYVNTSNNVVKAQTYATGGTTRTATVAGDCADGYWHDIHVLWKAGWLVIYRDGVQGTPITAIVTADIPDDLDRIEYGEARIAGLQCYRRAVYTGRLAA